MIIYFETKQVQVTNFVSRRLPEMPPKAKIRGPTDPKQQKLSFFTNKSTESLSSPDSAEVSEEQTKTNDNDVRHFQSKWLTLHPWLEFDGTKMFCKHCKQFGMQNIFTTGNTNFRTSTLTRHIASNDHQRAIMAPREQENLKKTVENVHNKEEKAIVIAMKAIYWLSKEGIALSKYSSMIRFLKDIGVSDIDSLNVNKHVDYSSYNTANDLLKSISNVINNDTTERLRRSPHLTILTDESTDIANHLKLSISARIINPSSLQVF